MKARKIPVYPIADYFGGVARDTGNFVGTIEESIAQRPNRLAIHRHDYFELYLLDGQGEHFNDFETYAIETTSIVCGHLKYCGENRSRIVSTRPKSSQL